MASNWFFGLFVAIFAAEALWLSLTSRYGMAFDEGYHFGLIQFFSHHLSPIISSQPSNSYNLGAIVHNSSFLYHYLLSFPYRLLIHFTDNLKVIVILLRLINLSLAIANLLIIKRFLKELNLPRLPANLIVFVFAFTPMVSVLAAQINYDNLLLPLISLTLLLTTVFVKRLGKNKLDLQTLITILALCLFASLVKFEFLPVLVGAVSVIATGLYRHYRGRMRPLGTDIKKSLGLISRRTKTMLFLAIVVGLSLFTLAYGVNLAKYHNPVPSCDQILDIKACSQYYAWNRNHTLAITKAAGTPVMNIVRYTYLWIRVMYYQIFGEINPSGGLIYIQPVFKVMVFLLSGLGGLSTLLNWRKLAGNKLLLMWGGISLIYLLVLLSRNYHDYLQLGEPVAVQGRYLLPVLPFIFTTLGMGIHFMLQGQNLAQRLGKVLIAALILFSCLYWGGFVRYSQTVSPDSHWPKHIPKIDT